MIDDSAICNFGGNYYCHFTLTLSNVSNAISLITYYFFLWYILCTVYIYIYSTTYILVYLILCARKL